MLFVGGDLFFGIFFCRMGGDFLIIVLLPAEIEQFSVFRMRKVFREEWRVVVIEVFSLY